MDELLSRSSLPKGVRFVAQPIADSSGKLGDTRDMIVDAATKMSRRSHFFRISLAPPKDPETVVFVPFGSVTGFEQGVESTGGGVGASIAQIGGASARRRNTTSTLTVSFYLVDNSGTVIDGTFSSAQLVLRAKEKSSLFSGALSVFNGSLALDSTRADAPTAGVKALIDLGMIQAVGALAQLPYASCLAQIAAAPGDTATDSKTWQKLKIADREAAIAAELVRRGLAPPDATPVQLRQAIAAYQRSQGMAVSGEASFEVYQSLRGAQTVASPMNRPPRGVPSVKVSPSGAAFRYGQNGGLPTVNAQDRLAFEVTVAEPGFVACYYTDADGSAMRVFPHDRRPAYRLSAGEVLRIPGEQDGFVIKPVRPGTREWLTCFAANDDFLPRLAPALPNVAFSKLPGITTATQLVTLVKNADSAITSDTASFNVAN